MFVKSFMNIKNRVNRLPRRLLFLIPIAILVIVSGTFAYAARNESTQKPQVMHHAAATSAGSTPAKSNVKSAPIAAAVPESMSTSTVSATSTTSTKPSSPSQPVTTTPSCQTEDVCQEADNTTPAAGNTPTGIVYGTPHITWSYVPAYADEDANNCYYAIALDVSVDNWQGYSSGEISLTMTMQTQNDGIFPYSINYTLTPGASKTFTNVFTIPRNPNGDIVTAAATVAGGVNAGSLGDSFLYTYVQAPQAANFSSNCD